MSKICRRRLEALVDSVSVRLKIEEDQKGYPQKGVSMKRPNFPYFRAFYTVVSKGNVQKSP